MIRLNDRTVTDYLEKNPQLLDSIVLSRKITYQRFNKWAKLRGAFPMNKVEEPDSQGISHFLQTVLPLLLIKMDPLNETMKKFMGAARKMLKCERASIFIKEGDQAITRLIDKGNVIGKIPNVWNTDKNGVQFEKAQGICGHVIATGHPLNVPDVKMCSVFDPKIDTHPGFAVHSILSVPIILEKKVIGVLQMLNRSIDAFTKKNERDLMTLAFFCGVAIEQCKLIKRREKQFEAKLEVAKELLEYHSVCSIEEINELRAVKEKPPADLMLYNFDGTRLMKPSKAFTAVYMFNDLFHGHMLIDQSILHRFVLTVRKNYRSVPYHNWDHGWSVAQAMYSMVKNMPGKFNMTEALALFVSCLCHDLDHRGMNNAYMKTAKTSLSGLYESSIMENHHYDQTVRILQYEGHNIFKYLCKADYEKLLKLIKHSILATDLAVYFANRNKLQTILETKTLEEYNPSHRLLGMALTMTACDLISSAKPWDVHLKTTELIYKEFYGQGDAERKRGRMPIAMMDSTQKRDIPIHQVDFIENLCLPCYDFLVGFFPCPQTMGVRDSCRTNAMRWKHIIAEESRKETTRSEKAATPHPLSG